jgi:asparagine synthase (glutamine-hydrolysing)
MCGIAGFLGRGDADDLQRMTDALVHRGPDAGGHWSDPERGLWLGHRRLSVIDHAGGAQPMWTADAALGITFNGEIYNHEALRSELESRGHLFQSSHSDTEVLLHGWREWGAALLERLNGMWAFALVDRRRDTLVLSRDRFGQKPLYYAERPGCFVFASELAALTRHPEVSRGLSREGMLKYYAYGFIPAPHSMLEGVSKLEPGGLIEVPLRGGAALVSRWWEFRIEPETTPRSHDDLADELRDRLERAVARRMVADVPVGVFLSGGIDSSAVAALARHGPHGDQLRTYAIGFEDPSFDESRWATRVALHLGTRHRSTNFSMSRARESLRELAAKLDEPIADASLGPTSLLCQEARTEVTVALGGDGGDELFAGYDPLRVLGLASHWKRLVPGPVHEAVRTLISHLPVSHRNLSLDFLAKRTLRGLSYPEAMWHPIWLGCIEPREFSDFIAGPVDIDSVYSEAIDAWDACQGPLVDKSLTFFTRLYLSGDILPKVDRASMQHALEVRSPFLDIELVDFARRLPHDLKLRQGETKWLLKRAMKGLIPDDVILRPKKGFGMPIGAWLQEGLLGAAEPPGSFHAPAFTERMRYEHGSGAADHRQFLFASWLADRVHAGTHDAGTETAGHSEAAFLRRIAPITREGFAGARVLDAGCMGGLTSHFAAALGAARVVAIDDAEPAIDVARAALASTPHVDVLRRRLCDLSYTREFDLCLCLDALHRSAMPRVAVEKLIQALVPGGTLIATLRPGQDPMSLFEDQDITKYETSPTPGGGTKVIIER